MQVPKNLIEMAVRAAHAGSKEIMEVYGEAFEVEIKSDKSPLTEADRRAHIKISEVLMTSGLPILSEEGAQNPFEERKNWDLFWMVDPLDGTKEFVKRNGEFTVNIALIHDGNPVMGVILVPVTGDLYFGSIETGAFKFKGFNQPHLEIDNWIDSAQRLPIIEDNRPYTVVGSRSHPSPETEAYLETLKSEYGNLEFVSMGSSLKICLVAEGAADIYPRFAPTMEWDTAAGHGIAKAAGKEIFDHSTGMPMKYNKENLLNNWFIVK